MNEFLEGNRYVVPSANVKLDPALLGLSGSVVGSALGALLPGVTTLEGTMLGGSMGTGTAWGSNIGGALGSLLGSKLGLNRKFIAGLGSVLGGAGGGLLAAKLTRSLINKHNESRRKREWEEYWENIQRMKKESSVAKPAPVSLIKVAEFCTGVQATPYTEEMIKEAFMRAMMTSMRRMGGRMLRSVGRRFDAMGNKFRNMAKTTGQQAGGPGVTDYVKGKMQGARDYVTGKVQGAKDYVTRGVNKVRDTVGSKVEGWGNKIRGQNNTGAAPQQPAKGNGSQPAANGNTSPQAAQGEATKNTAPAAEQTPKATAPEATQPAAQPQQPAPAAQPAQPTTTVQGQNTTNYSMSGFDSPAATTVPGTTGAAPAAAPAASMTPTPQQYFNPYQPNPAANFIQPLGYGLLGGAAGMYMMGGRGNSQQ